VPDELALARSPKTTGTSPQARACVKSQPSLCSHRGSLEIALLHFNAQTSST
jgi:hypothetical protein